MNRFIIQQSSRKPEIWVCTDTLHLIVCSFENKKFNDTKKITVLEDIDAENNLMLSSYLQEMRDWLRIYHAEKYF
jgi:hypothetical protein